MSQYLINTDPKLLALQDFLEHTMLIRYAVIEDVSLIQEMVATYAPDFLLVELGFNDIGWGISNAPTTIQSMESFIANARAANPNLNFAIANIPQRTSLGTANPDLSEKTTDYNSLLAIAIPSWSTAESPIALVDFAGNYDCVQIHVVFFPLEANPMSRWS